ncbi:hypothetical protein MFU01_50500 [Myxococcus fulvus]|uniref:Uncharacterized protein n=1 Tax=Myxococcus fulvus TaxID=33 RepID=A0A511T8U3_MYXFU|nr:hypothetical protein MFU01_50500 [Myxococcus fulvus]
MLMALALVAGSPSVAQEDGGVGRAVRISSGSWTAMDAAVEAGFLTRYQYSQGVSLLPTSQALWQETLSTGALDGLDLLVVDAEEDTALLVDEGVALSDVLRQLIGPDVDRLRPDEMYGDDSKPLVPQLVLVLPAGTLAELFPEGSEVEVHPVLALEPQRLLGVRPQTPCEGKCDEPLAATQVVATRLDDGAVLPLPVQVLANQPPDTAPQPVVNRGSLQIDIVSRTETGVLLRAEAGSGADLYQWVVTSANGTRWTLGDTTSSAVEFTMEAEQGTDTRLLLCARMLVWDPLRQRWLIKELPGCHLDTFPPPEKFVGVIPEAQTCPQQSDLLVVHMDDEDGKSASTSRGWLGGITSDRNTTLRFCRVDAAKFKPLSKDSIRQNHYAVLMLGDTCPAGSYRFSRYFDNEDKSNANYVRVHFDWRPSSADKNTSLVFCVFLAAGTTGSTMSEMPQLGFSYGVLAAADFSRALATGTLDSNDEDDTNKNTYTDPHSIYNHVVPIISMSTDTRIRLAKVR